MVSEAPLTRVCYVRVEEWPAGRRYTVVAIRNIADRGTEQAHSCPDVAEALRLVEAFLMRRS
jgi:hypothetical protein